MKIGSSSALRVNTVVVRDISEQRNEYKCKAPLVMKGLRTTPQLFHRLPSSHARVLLYREQAATVPQKNAKKGGKDTATKIKEKNKGNFKRQESGEVADDRTPRTSATAETPNELKSKSSVAKSPEGAKFSPPTKLSKRNRRGSRPLPIMVSYTENGDSTTNTSMTMRNWVKTQLHKRRPSGMNTRTTVQQSSTQAKTHVLHKCYPDPRARLRWKATADAATIGNASEDMAASGIL